MSRVIYVFGGLLIFLSATTDFVGVVIRILAIPTVEFGTSFSIWLVAWAAFLAAAPLVAEKGGHIAIMALPTIAGPKAAKYLEKFALLCTLVMAALIAYGASLMTISLFRREATYSLAMNVPQYLVKLCVFVGMALMVGYCLVALVRGMSSPEDDRSPTL